jgi:hypothetical protein
MSKKTRRETAKLAKMKVNELQAKFAEVTGEKTRSPNKTFLIRKIAEALQAKEGVESSSPGAKAATTVATKAGGPVTEKLTRLDVSELQARYLELVGRPSGSTNKAYLIWKIREAKKGHIVLGPRKSAHRNGVTFKVLPLRMESAVVDKMDEAWRSRGIKNRTAFFRGALGHYLKHIGDEESAALFADAAAQGS